ncbi:uncharacterized protein LOC117371270 isoform X2 [Periophthalmus magnuspinnatus]|uniref:uncharacterized protein LOC117371270 isoform X2 n=1 Tax=Periophthalmus magnuspinnatus TaxID=409849 RepID=UPI00243692F5|nr:uncharacterized protein LOC117371270 isoform X2 [Periophthalmus magnuspinnatus]
MEEDICYHCNYQHFLFITVFCRSNHICEHGNSSSNKSKTIYGFWYVNDCTKIFHDYITDIFTNSSNKCANIHIHNATSDFKTNHSAVYTIYPYICQCRDIKSIFHKHDQSFITNISSSNHICEHGNSSSNKSKTIYGFCNHICEHGNSSSNKSKTIYGFCYVNDCTKIFHNYITDIFTNSSNKCANIHIHNATSDFKTNHSAVYTIYPYICQCRDIKSIFHKHDQSFITNISSSNHICEHGNSSSNKSKTIYGFWYVNDCTKIFHDYITDIFTNSSNKCANIHIHNATSDFKTNHSAVYTIYPYICQCRDIKSIFHKHDQSFITNISSSNHICEHGNSSSNKSKTIYGFWYVNDCTKIFHDYITDIFTNSSNKCANIHIHNTTSDFKTNHSAVYTIYPYICQCRDIKSIFHKHDQSFITNISSSNHICEHGNSSSNKSKTIYGFWYVNDCTKIFHDYITDIFTNSSNKCANIHIHNATSDFKTNHSAVYTIYPYICQCRDIKSIFHKHDQSFITNISSSNHICEHGNSSSNKSKTIYGFWYVNDCTKIFHDYITDIFTNSSNKCANIHIHNATSDFKTNHSAVYTIYPYICQCRDIKSIFHKHD